MSPARSYPLRLMHITHDVDIGGLQNVILTICKGIDRDLFEPSVLCLRARGAFEEEFARIGVRVHSVAPQPGHTAYLLCRSVARVLRRERIDVVHTHNTQPLVDGGIGALIAGIRAVVHTDHARLFPDKRRYMFAEWLMSHAVHRFVGCSEHTTEQLRRFEHIPARKLITVPNGIDATRFRQPHNRAAIRRALGINSAHVAFGTAVRLTQQKGLRYLVEAIPAVVKAVPNARFFIAGEGPEESALRDQARSTGCGDVVTFLGPRQDIPDILHALDVFVLPSVWEGLPLALLEAMAAGCAIVATSVGGTPSAVQNGQNGLLVPPQDPAALAAALITMGSNPDVRARHAQNGLRVFSERFDAAVMTRAYQQLYFDALGMSSH